MSLLSIMTRRKGRVGVAHRPHPSVPHAALAEVPAPVALPDPVVRSTSLSTAFPFGAMNSGGVRQRMFQALRSGATIPAAAVQAGISLPLAEVVVEEMRRMGLLGEAASFCSSGLGACEGGTGVEAQIHCAACPLVGLKKN